MACKLQNWKEALLIVKSETVLRWHRRGFRVVWKQKSCVRSRDRKMAAENRLWGAERIRGESGARWAKVGIHVAKRTVQRYMRQARPQRPHGQTWAKNAFVEPLMRMVEPLIGMLRSS
jgi:putative transposase